MARAERILTALVACLGLAACLPQAYGTADRYAYHATAVALTMPVDAPPISQQFTPPATRQEQGHWGIDIRAAEGSPVIAPAPGVVERVFSDAAYGNQLVIDHGIDKSGTRVITRYKHLLKTTVKPGQKLRRGEEIGKLGGTGFLGLYPHLHFELHRGKTRKSTAPVDPHLYWLNGKGRITCLRKGKRYPRSPARLTYPVICARP